MVTVNYDDLSDAFDFVSAAAPFEHGAFVSLDTGAIYWVSDGDPVGDEDVPDDLETSDRYIAMPHKNDLDLGRDLVFRFIDEYFPERGADVDAIFRRRGAYAKFKDLLEHERALEKWYSFEAESTDRALRQWCAENGIQLTGDRGTAA